MVAFAISQYMCTTVKIYLVLGVLVVSVLGYYATEIVATKKDPVYAIQCMDENAGAMKPVCHCAVPLGCAVFYWLLRQLATDLK